MVIGQKTQMRFVSTAGAQLATPGTIIRLIIEAETRADDLVIQWDVAWEFVDMAIGDKRLFAFFPHLTAEDKFQRYAAQLDDLWQDIPDEALFGYHWCYGTWGGWPMVALADQLALVAGQQLAQRGVDAHVLPVGVEERHPDRRVIEGGFHRRGCCLA